MCTSRLAAVEQVDLLVIGGGRAGLSAAYHLSRTGIDQLLLDANPGAGGLAAPMADADHGRNERHSGAARLSGPGGGAELKASDALPSYFAG